MAISGILIVFLGTFILVSAAVWIARALMNRNLEETLPSLEAETAPSLAGEEELPLLLRQSQVSSISLWARLLDSLNLSERIRIAISQADLNWTAGRLTLGMLFCGTASMALLGSIPWIPFWALTALSAVVALGPYFYVLRRKEKRIQQVEDQFPDTLDSLARALRAGHPFASALDYVANQTPNPLGRELRKTFAEGALGSPWDKALENLGRRLPIPEVAMFVAAVQMHSRSGGNLSEILETLSENMREGAALRGEVRALTSQGRFAGRILSVLPVAIAVILFYVNPGFLLPLLTDPTGKTLLMASVFALLLAHVIIHKLTDIRL